MVNTIQAASSRPTWLQQTPINRQGLFKAIKHVNILSGDYSMYTREIWRNLSGAIPSDRLLDYGWRGISNEVNSPIRETVLRLDRMFLNIPMIESGLELDKLLEQHHLTNHIPRELIPEKALLKDWPMLIERLAYDSNARKAGDFKVAPDLLWQIDQHLFDRLDEAGKPYWSRERIGPDHPVVVHLNYRLNFRNFISRVRHTLDTPERPLPYFEGASREAVIQAVDDVKAGMDHISDLKMDKYLMRAPSLFQDMANGRFSGRNGSLNKQDAINILNKVRGEGLLGTQNRPQRKLLEHLFKHVSAHPDTPPPEGFGALKKGVAEYFSMYKAPHQVAEKALNQQWLGGKLTGNLDAAYVEKVLRALMAEQVQVGNQTIRFSFNAKKLGLTTDNLSDVARNLATHTNELSDFLNRASQQLQQSHTTESFATLGKNLGHEFETRWLGLISQLPGKTGQHEALTRIMTSGVEDRLYKLFADGLKHFSAINMLERTSKTFFWPQIVMSMMTAPLFIGGVWSWFDNHMIQPIQEDVTLTRGDVRGATGGYVAAGVAGAITFNRLMAGDLLRNVFRGNNWSYVLRLSTAALAGVVTASAVGASVMSLIFQHKPLSEAMKQAKLAHTKAMMNPSSVEPINKSGPIASTGQLSSGVGKPVSTESPFELSSPTSTLLRNPVYQNARVVPMPMNDLATRAIPIQVLMQQPAGTVPYSVVNPMSLTMAPGPAVPFTTPAMPSNPVLRPLSTEQHSATR